MTSDVWKGLKRSSSSAILLRLLLLILLISDVSCLHLQSKEESIPIALTRSHILPRATNGTASFCIRAMEKIDQNNNVIQAVILVPTRELALQTSQVCKELGKHSKIQVMVSTRSLKDDILRMYQPVHLLVGTPGRILDLAKMGVCILKDCQMLVMDEADKLLFPEFQPSVKQLDRFLPRTRQIYWYRIVQELGMEIKQIRPDIDQAMNCW